MRRARSIGIAKPSPSDPPEREKIEELTPMTSPSAFTSGPPELPGLIAASVWIMSAYSTSSPLPRISRPTPLITPVVTVASVFWSWKPEGFPIAIAGSPMNRSDEIPSGAGGITPGSTFTTARSVNSSEPTSSPRRTRPTSSITTMESASLMTC